MRRLGNHPCQTILHMLKFQDVIESYIMIKGIVIIKSTANKSSCNNFGKNKIHILTNMTKVTNMIKTWYMYSFTQVNELRQRGLDKIAQTLKRQQEDSNTGSLD